MPARRVVVVLRQHPADLFRPVARHGQGKLAAGFEHAVNLAQCQWHVGQVFENFRADDSIKAIVCKGQAARIAHGEDRCARGIFRWRGQLEKAIDRRAQIGKIEVQPGHVQRAFVPVQRMQVTAAPAAQIQYALAVGKVQAVGVDCHHAAITPASVRPSTSR